MLPSSFARGAPSFAPCLCPLAPSPRPRNAKSPGRCFLPGLSLVDMFYALPSQQACLPPGLLTGRRLLGCRMRGGIEPCVQIRNAVVEYKAMCGLVSILNYVLLRMVRVLRDSNSAGFSSEEKKTSYNCIYLNIKNKIMHNLHQ